MININLINVELREIFFEIIFVSNRKKTYASIKCDFSTNDAVDVNDDETYILIASTEYDFIVVDSIDDAVTDDINNIADDSDER